jgi:hypothetical protein
MPRLPSRQRRAGAHPLISDDRDGRELWVSNEQRAREGERRARESEQRARENEQRARRELERSLKRQAELEAELRRLKEPARSD